MNIYYKTVLDWISFSLVYLLSQTKCTYTVELYLDYPHRKWYRQAPDPCMLSYNMYSKVCTPTDGSATMG